jgi:hypothetical protein
VYKKQNFTFLLQRVYKEKVLKISDAGTEHFSNIINHVPETDKLTFCFGRSQ